MKSSLAFGGALAAIVLFGNVGCSTAPEKPAAREQLDNNADSTLKNMKAADPTLAGVLDHSAGWAIFPSVGKGGFIAGAAYGRGQVYDAKGSFLGYSDLKQGTVGAQAGAQTYDELIVFKDTEALNKFMSGQFALSANYSAVLLKANAADSANWNDGVLVLVKPEGGAMLEASIGGQKFSFVRDAGVHENGTQPASHTERTTTTIERDADRDVHTDVKTDDHHDSIKVRGEIEPKTND
jgi:lipid-binding SYLF domain-containing protein